MMNKGRDIRIIQLAKWQIPKSKSLFEDTDGDGSNFLAIGYFDMIEAVGAGTDEKEHPLTAAYKGLPRYGKTDRAEDYTVQELILFTDTGDGIITQEAVNRFWKDESLIMFISLIHVDNESNIDGIVSRICETFKNQCFLYYFSFDYSGIILLAKNMKIETYVTFMFQLNYGKTNGRDMIRDSYSVFGFQKKCLKKYFEQAEDGFHNINGLHDDEKFSTVVNIGVKNYCRYDEFLKLLESTGIQSQKWRLLGRHDISVVNDSGNLKWLVYLQYLLDKFTKRSKNGDEQLFYTHETFVKIKMREQENLPAVEQMKTGEDLFFHTVQERLDFLCNRFSEQLSKKAKLYNGEYEMPVRAVKHSILSILRNRFAEDFVLCMYASFCEFLVYLTEKLSNEEDNVDEFDKCYERYFKGLNSLVNSAMHSERQFIQATAFNAIIYDVPSKIMAFYIAVIYEIQQIIKSGVDKKYTFLLTPSFSNEIRVGIISYQKEILPHDRIMIVKINEKFLYNPKGVLRRMAHEVAHYLGDSVRNREARKDYFIMSMIVILLSGILNPVFIDTDNFFDLAESIRKKLP